MEEIGVIDMRSMLARRRSEKFVGASALADAALELLRNSGIEQERGTVSDFPDERTVRFYLSEGLIDAPEERRGSASLFSYRNLLQLLVVKKLQAEHFSIRKIREIVSGRNETELEELLTEESSVRSSGGDAMTYLRGLLSDTRVSAPLANRVSAPLADSLSFALMSEARSMPPEEHSWRRLELKDGLELHIRDDVKILHDKRELKRLSARILDVLSDYGKTPGKTEE